MAGMQQVEAAVGEADRKALSAPVLANRTPFVDGSEASLAKGRGLLVERRLCAQFVQRDGRRAGFGNHDSRRKIGEAHRLFDWQCAD